MSEAKVFIVTGALSFPEALGSLAVMKEEHDRVVAEMQKRIERLEKALNEIANYGATLDGVVAFSMKDMARKALEVEK